MKNILIILLAVICLNLSGQYNDLTKDHITANYFVKSKKTMEADSIYLRGFGYVSGYILKKLAHDTMYAHLLAYDHHDSLTIDGSGLIKVGVQKLGIDTNKILTKWDTLLIHNQLQSWFNSLAKTIDANDTTYWGKSLKPSDTTGFKVQTKTAFKNDTVNNSKTGTVTPWRWNYWNNKGGGSTTLTVYTTNLTGPLSYTNTAINICASSNMPGTTFVWTGPSGFNSTDSSAWCSNAGLYIVVATNGSQISQNYIYVTRLSFNSDYGYVISVDTIKGFLANNYIISTIYADTGNISTSETFLFRCQIPAKTMYLNGNKIIAEYYMSYAGSEERHVRVYFNATQLCDVIVVSNGHRISVFLIRTGSSSAMIQTTSYESGSGSIGTTFTKIASGIDWNSVNMLNLTGQATTTNSIMCSGGYVEFKK